MKHRLISLEKVLLLLFIALLGGAFFFVFHDPEPFREEIRVENKAAPAAAGQGLSPRPSNLSHVSPPEVAPVAPVESRPEPQAPPAVVSPEVKTPRADFGIQGVVFVRASGLPLANCEVAFLDHRVLTDSRGEFSFWQTEGVGTLRFSCQGYRSRMIKNFRIGAGDFLSHLEVFMAEVDDPEPGRIEVNGISGRVYDQLSGAPLAGARIVVGASQTKTDAAGFFELWGNDSGLVTMLVSTAEHVSEMVSGIDFDNRNHPYFFEIFLERKPADGQPRLALVGIGVRMVKSERGYEIADILADSPAAREGLLTGDRLLAVDRLAVDDFSLQEVVELIRGQAEEPVTLMVEREGNLIEVVCVRERVLY
ncbi:MAG TPA: PDZ domain-containing protein [Proteobacteria bacterium]|nr:PDZ domain-containing protein [Pseudomonadota bacterium]